MLEKVSNLGRAAVQRVARWLGPYAAMWLLLVVGVAFVSAMTVVAAEIYESVVEQDGAAAFDRPVLEWFKSLRNPALDSAITAFTNLGGVIGMPIIAVLGLVFFTLRSRTWRATILIVAVSAGSLLITTLGKYGLGRARPAQIDAVPPFETSPSFPSGHTLNATAIVAVLTYLTWLTFESRVAKVAATVVGVLFVVAMGASRVFLGHHWLTDVLAAFALGLAWAAVVILAHRTYWMVHEARQQEHQPPSDR